MKFVASLVVGLCLICCTFAWTITMDNHSQFLYWLHAVVALLLLYFLVHMERNTHNMFEDFLEKFKTIMRTGNDTIGIPILDPFTADEIPIVVDNEMMILDALLTIVKVDGLSAYNVNKGDFKLIGLKLIMNLSWPLITASTNYNMMGKVDNFEIYGNGEMKISPQDFCFETEIDFTMKGKYLKVKAMKLKIFLKAFEFHATGLYNDNHLSELLSAVISDMMPQLIMDYHDMITDKASLLIMDKLNAFLSTMTLAELMKLLGL
ncbi:uncharacterized protein [Anoplolepis gracilipes]|uniref:uncharacterized protein isoform X2 n=1 Tax=Anoplolepis gracilipes TaxID=354296 RepID=UPI003B9F1742